MGASEKENSTVCREATRRANWFCPATSGARKGIQGQILESGRFSERHSQRLGLWGPLAREVHPESLAVKPPPHVSMLNHRHVSLLQPTRRSPTARQPPICNLV